MVPSHQRDWPQGRVHRRNPQRPFGPARRGVRARFLQFDHTGYIVLGADPHTPSRGQGCRRVRGHKPRDKDRARQAPRLRCRRTNHVCDVRTALIPRHGQVIGLWRVQPKCGRGAETACQTQSRVGRYRMRVLCGEDPGDPVGRRVERARQGVCAKANRDHKPFLQHFSRGCSDAHFVGGSVVVHGFNVGRIGVSPDKSAAPLLYPDTVPSDAAALERFQVIAPRDA